MGTLRETLIAAFDDGKSPTGAQFKLLIDSIVSRNDDGIDKGNDTAIKISAGKELHAPIINFCPKDVLDPHWVVSLKVGGKDGLNFGQGNTPTNPVLYLDKASSNVGIGTSNPAEALSMQRDINGRNGLLIANEATGDQNHVILRLKNDDGEGVIFKNSSLRSVDGGFHTMTIRNESGDLRLLGAGEKAKLLLKGDVNGFVGINTDNPTDALTVNGNISLQGNSLFFPLSTATVDTLAKAGVFWTGSGTDTSKYGIYKTDGPWTAPAYQQLRLQFDTGIQLGAGTASSKSYVDVVNGKGLMVSAGNLGVGTVNPSAKAHIVTTSSEGDMTSWGAGQLVVGQEPKDGNGAGGIGLSYSTASNTGYISTHSPGGSWRNMGLRANAFLLYNGTTEMMRLTPDGKLGLGTAAPEYQMEARKDANAGNYGFGVSNLNAGTGAFAGMLLRTDGPGPGVLFKNSSTRTLDGGVNAMTLRNDGGDLRLQAIGGYNNALGITVKANTGHVGIGTSLPSARLQVVTASASGLPDTGPWDGTSFVVGQEPANGAGAGGVGISYALATNTGTIVSNSPGIGWRDLALRSRDTILYANGANETMRVTNGGRVGIGTAAPDYLVEVRKDQNVAHWALGLTNMATDGDSYVGMALKTGTAGHGVLIKNTSARTSDGGPNALTLRNEGGDLRLQAQGGAIGLFVKAISGFVGIGTTNPLSRLDVAGGALLIGSGLTNGSPRPAISALRLAGEIAGYSGNGLAADDGFLRLSGGGGTSPGAKAYIDISGYSTVADMSVNIAFGTAGVERMRIAPDGSVGIGTSIPKHKLQLNGGNFGFYASDNPALRSDAGFPNLGSIYFYGHGRNVPNDSASIVCGSTTSDEQGYLAFATSNDGAASTEKLRITELGRVGINTPAPYTRMHLASAGALTAGNGFLLGKINDSMRTSTVQGEELGNIELGFTGWRDSTPNQVGAKISAIRIANYGAPNAHLIQGSELSFSTGEGVGNGTDTFQDTSVERLRIKKDGKVGIGTTSPKAMLGVAGSLAVGYWGATNAVPPTNGLFVEGDTFLNGAASINRSLKVGPSAIGLPNSIELSVDGASPVANRLIFGTDNTGWKMALSKRSPNGVITDILSLNDDGRVGIGNITPFGKLHVVTPASDGVVGSWGEGQFVVGQAGNGGGLGMSYSGDTGYLTSLSPSTAWRNLMLRGATLLFNTNNGEAMRVANNNYVGIGQNNPSNLLDIQLGGRSGSHANGRPLYVTSEMGPDSNGVEFRHNNGTQGIGIGYNTVYAAPSGGVQDINLKSAGAGNVNLVANGAIGLTLAGGSRNVGIGTTGPEMLLDLRRDSGGGSHVLQLTNYGNSTDSYVLMGLRTSNSYGIMFKNGPGRAADGGVNTLTLRNDLGDTRLQAQGATNGLQVKAGTGYVGIGTTNAEAPLSIGDQGGKWQFPNTTMHFTSDTIIFGGANTGREANSCQISAARHVGNSMCIVGMSDTNGANRRVEMWAEYAFALNGRMGIGTRDPSYPLHIPASAYSWVGPDYHYMNANSVGHYQGVYCNVSLMAGGRIVCPEFNTVSDQRIKKNILRSDAKSDMLLLQKVVVNDYEYRDQSGKNANLNKGFIAQQIKGIFPEAVSEHREFVPDIFANPIGTSLEGGSNEEENHDSISLGGKSKARTLKLIMAEPHSLITGDMVRLGSKHGVDEREVKVVNNTTFTVQDWEHGDEGIFVYGKRVDDFMVVDYNRIYTLNVSTTQELCREVDALKAENAELRDQLFAIKKALALAGIDVA